MTDLVPKILLGFAALATAYGYGVVSVRQKLFPSPTIEAAEAAFLDLKDNWRNDAGLEPIRHLTKSRRPGAGVTVRDQAAMAPGPTLMAGLFDGQIAARLIASDGRVIHEWPVSYNAIWSEPRRKQKPLGDWNVFLHGIVALPDGSIVFNFDEGGSLVKMNRCGEVEWKIDRYIHHVVELAEDGTFWVLLADDVAQISADGEIIRRLSIVKMMNDNQLEGALYIHKPDKARIHPNDVEPLPAAWADAFPLFEAGDLLYSARDLNMIMVFDPDTLVVKWYQHGPWLRQHDPDFLPNGRISIFNNRWKHGNSNIMTIDPVTRQVEVVYGDAEGQQFYTSIRGKHQYLANGNILITEAQAGRVLEVTPAGEIVWEYLNRYDEERMAVVAKANRYAPDYFDTDGWSCDKQAES